jgi:serine phosphatase RsbU (regulator of sigma subunit)
VGSAGRRRALAEQLEINTMLRQAILPDPAPAVDVSGVRVAVRYHAADRTALVGGGDWYLSDPLPCGGLLLAVRDVVGHRLAAAATMVQLRHAMVGLAVAGHPPNEILAAINRLFLRQRAGRASTAVVATYRPDSHRPTWAHAGHPPILVANRDGVEALWHPAGAVLGVLPEAHYADATSRIATGDLVVMYTDGFVEERGRMVDDGVRVLGDQARLAMTGPLGDRPAAVVGRLRRRNPDDDACVLAAAPL